jgi:hypothetical protein
MSTIKALVPYRIETFRPHAAGRMDQNGQAPHQPAQDEKHAPAAARPARSTPFIAQLIVQSDADLRKALGRTDIAQARQSAYTEALAKRPSAQGLNFRQNLGAA